MMMRATISIIMLASRPTASPTQHHHRCHTHALASLVLFLLALLSLRCDGAAVMEEDDAGALHINTSDPLLQPVYLNGMDVSALLAAQQDVIESQASQLAELQDESKALRALLCRRYPLSASLIAGAGSVSSKWAGGVLANNGLIYGIPFSAEFVLIIDPATNTIDLSTIPTLFGGSKWSGGVLAGNGLIFGMPHDARSAFIINPEANTADPVTVQGFSPNQAKWGSAVLGNNGLIYGIPFTAPSVLIINPDTKASDTDALSGLTGSGLGGFKWYGGVVPDTTSTKIFCIPRDAEAVLIIDTATNNTDVTVIAGLPQQSFKWLGGVLAPSGLIYSIPAGIKNVLIIDPTANTTDITSIDGFSGSNKWIGGVRTTDGRVIGIPYSSSALLVIDPATQSSERIALGQLDGLDPSEFRWWDGVVADNGAVYAIPFDAQHVLVIDPGC